MSRIWCGAGCLLICAICIGCQTTRTAPEPHFIRDRERAEQRNQQGLTALESGNLDTAERQLRAAVDADPFFGAAHSNLGVCLLRSGKLYEAAWHLRHASQLLPRATEPRVNLGILFEEVGRLGEAEEQLLAAEELAHGDVIIAGQLARLDIRRKAWTPETRRRLELVASEHHDPLWRDWARTELSQH